MSTTVQSWRPAWEPLTPRGVGAFAGGSLGRLLLVQLLVASLVAASVIWFLERGWFPVVRTAIHQLPAAGEISDGQLDWHGETPVQLAENRFLGFAVDLYHSGRLGRAAHLQVEFGKDDLRVYSLPGYQVIDYPPDWKMAFNRTDLEPRWGAWEPFIAVGVAMVTVVGLMVSWTALATFYFVPVWVISFLENRDLNLAQSWRLAGATMMPGALFLVAGIVAYSLSWIDLIQLVAMWGLHFIIGWIYLVIGPLFCPRGASVKAAGANPFAESKKSREG
jgi:hypothetical protein